MIYHVFLHWRSMAFNNGDWGAGKQNIRPTWTVNLKILHIDKTTLLVLYLEVSSSVSVETPLASKAQIHYTVTVCHSQKQTADAWMK